MLSVLEYVQTLTYRLSLLLDKICYFNVDEEIEMMDDKYIQYFDDEWKLNSLQLEKIEGIFEEGILLTKRDAYMTAILTKYQTGGSLWIPYILCTNCV